MKHDPVHHTGPTRAFVLFGSGRRLDLLNPRSDGWTDEDLAHNLARINRWAGRRDGANPSRALSTACSFFKSARSNRI